MSFEALIAWVGGLLFVRYVGLPWIRTRLFGPPALGPAWEIALKRHALESSFVRDGLRWTLAVRIPAGHDRWVEVKARTTERVQVVTGLNALLRLRADLPAEPPESATELIADARDVLPAGLTIRGVPAEQTESARRDRLANGEEPNELLHFFDAVTARGDEAVIAALLDEETRALLRVSVHQLGFEIDRGRIRFRAANLAANHPYLEQVIGRMKELVRALSIRPEEVLPRLIHIAQTDRSPHLRAHALRTLAASFPREKTAEVFQQARLDPSPVVRLEVIAALPSKIEELAAIFTDHQTTETTLKDALRIANHRFARPELEACVIALFRAHKHASARPRAFLIEALGRFKAVAVAAEIAALLEDPDPRVREACVRALGRMALPEHEDAVIARLGDEDSAVFVAAIKALAFCGTTSAIAPLRATYGSKALIDQSIARIVQRNGAPAAGTLSLVGGSGGDLSLAPGETGALSNPEDADQPMAAPR